tara:strand:+ start:1116 stop:1379 length:264 start_codon:yes stop_codon:yes gene_type:complete
VVDSPLTAAVAPSGTSHPVVDRTTAKTRDANAFVVDAVAVVRWAVEDVGVISGMFVERVELINPAIKALTVLLAWIAPVRLVFTDQL